MYLSMSVSNFSVLERPSVLVMAVLSIKDIDYDGSFKYYLCFLMSVCALLFSFSSSTSTYLAVIDAFLMDYLCSRRIFSSSLAMLM